MRVNLPLLYDQLRAAIRNDGGRNLPRQARRLKRSDSRSFSEGGEINEAKNYRRNSNFPGFGSFFAGTGRRIGLPNPMPGTLCSMY